MSACAPPLQVCCFSRVVEASPEVPEHLLLHMRSCEAARAAAAAVGPAQTATAGDDGEAEAADASTPAGAASA